MNKIQHSEMQTRVGNSIFMLKEKKRDEVRLLPETPGLERKILKVFNCAEPFLRKKLAIILISLLKKRMIESIL